MTLFRIPQTLIFGFFCAYICVAQTTEFPDGWSETGPPSAMISNGNSLACANYSRHEWKVSSTNIGLRVVDAGTEKREVTPLPQGFVRTSQMRGVAITAKTSDGWLIGFDAGEFGGGLWWFSKNGSTTRPISEENIHALVPRGDLVLVLTGLDHMGSNVGAIYAYRPDNHPSSTSLSLLADLGSSPGAASLTEGGDLFIATQGKVLMLRRNNKLETLYASTALGALYPNSIVEDKDGMLFVGMRFYVLELLPDASHKYSVKWFTTTACTKAHVKNYDCVCNARTIT
jgi:hypothetical protein